MDYRELVQKRRSVRVYREQPVPEDKMADIRAYFQKSKRLFPEINVDMRIVGSENKEKLEGIAGYMGFMVGAPSYMILLSDEHPYCVENVGYLGEDMVLRLTSLGINTCWVTFGSGQAVKEALGFTTDKEVVAIIAFGYGEPDEENVVLNKTTNSQVNIRYGKGYEAPKMGIGEMLFKKRWGEKIAAFDTSSGALHAAFSAASLAPTYLNRQPYRFILDDELVVLVMLKDDMTSEMDEKLNAGIVMLHFAAVIAQLFTDVHWVMGAPEGREHGLPEDGRAVAYCIV